jgi:hypothetical protein
MPSNVERAAELIAGHTPDLINEGPNGEDDGKHWYCVECGVLENPAPSFGAEHVAGILADAGLIPGDDTEVAVEWAVRFPAMDGSDDIQPRSELGARQALDHHSDPANNSTWRGQVWLVRRDVIRTPWRPVEDTDSEVRDE